MQENKSIKCVWSQRRLPTIEQRAGDGEYTFAGNEDALAVSFVFAQKASLANLLFF